MDDSLSIDVAENGLQALRKGDEPTVESMVMLGRLLVDRPSMLDDILGGLSYQEAKFLRFRAGTLAEEETNPADAHALRMLAAWY